MSTDVGAALVAAWAGPHRTVWDGETVRLGTYDDHIVTEWRPVAAGQVTVQGRMPVDVAVRLVAYLAALRDEATTGHRPDGDTTAEVGR